MRGSGSVGRAAVRGLVAAAAATVLWGAAGADEAGPEPEPALCREAREAHPDETAIRAIRLEEGERWREARRVAREGRRALRQGLGAIDRGGSRALVGDFARADDAHRRLMREASVLCGCRVARGDRDDANCARLYPGLGRPPPP